METTAVTIKDQLTGVEQSKAAEIKATFDPMVEMLQKFEAAYDEVMALNPEDLETAKKAKRLRLDIAKVRIQTGKLKDEKKKLLLIEGRAIDGINNILKHAVTEKEDNLKKLETYWERKEEERKKALESERVEILTQYEVDGTGLNLGDMADDVWHNFLTGTKANYQAKQEAERKAEEDRIAAEKKALVYRTRRESLLPYSEYLDPASLTAETTEEEFQALLKNGVQAKETAAAEADRIRRENERLKREQEEKAAREKKEKAEREAKEKAEREAREKKEAEERRAREEERRAQEAKIAEERRKREEAEEKARQEREARERKEREAREAKEAAERRKAAAPDREKLIGAVDYLFSLEFTTTAAGSAVCDATNILKKCIEEMAE